MMKSPSLTSMTPYCPSTTCTKDDAFRNYEEVAAELLLDVRQGGVALGSNKITKTGSHAFRTHNAILLRPLHALRWCSRKDDVSAANWQEAIIMGMSSLDN